MKSTFLMAAPWCLVLMGTAMAQNDPPEKAYIDKILDRREFTPEEEAALDLTGAGGVPDGIIDVRDLVVFLNGQVSDGALTDTGATVSGAYDLAAADGLTGPAVAADGIPLHDGVPNLLKYAFNMNLAGPDSHRMTPGGGSGLPGCGLVEEDGQTYWRVEYVRLKNSGLNYFPQKSMTLEDGSFNPMVGEVMVYDIPGEPEWERVVIDEPCDPATEDRCFSRVRVDGL